MEGYYGLLALVLSIIVLWALDKFVLSKRIPDIKEEDIPIDDPDAVEANRLNIPLDRYKSYKELFMKCKDVGRVYGYESKEYRAMCAECSRKAQRVDEWSVYISSLYEKLKIEMDEAARKEKEYNNKLKMKSMKEAIINLLRWVAVLPGAIIACMLASVIMKLLDSYFQAYVYANSWWLELVNSGVSGYAFVYAGCYIAPKYKYIVSIVLSTIMGIICVAGIICTLYGYGDFSLLMQILISVAAMIGCIVASSNEHVEESLRE